MNVMQRRLMATATNVGASHPLTGRPNPVALLPPIQLYRRCLRAHRKLPTQMRLLGDEYVKSEFRAHRDVENPMHIVSSRRFDRQQRLTL